MEAGLLGHVGGAARIREVMRSNGMELVGFGREQRGFGGRYEGYRTDSKEDMLMKRSMEKN